MLTSRCLFMLLLFIDCCACTRSIHAAARPIDLDTNYSRPTTSNPQGTLLTAYQYFSCSSPELGYNCRAFSGDNINVDKNQPVLSVDTHDLTTKAADIVSTSALKSQDNDEVDDRSKYDTVALIRRRTPPPGRPPHVHKAPEINSVNMLKTFHYPQCQDSESDHRVINSPSVIIHSLVQQVGHYKIEIASRPLLSDHKDHDAGAVFDSGPTFSVLRNKTPPPGRGSHTKLTLPG